MDLGNKPRKGLGCHVLCTMTDLTDLALWLSLREVFVDHAVSPLPNTGRAFGSASLSPVRASLIRVMVDGRKCVKDLGSLTLWVCRPNKGGLPILLQLLLHGY